ncbi:hypothetical protein [Sporomusa malonica]|nr:hypothetical protein [Sporomusa malonica]
MRGKLAIRMALDQMPAVIIYKGKVDTIVPVLRAFTAEKAAITVTTDGVPPSLALYKIYPGLLDLSPELQLLLVDVPPKLWLGETIHIIVPANFLGSDGALVITSHAVYFIDKPDGDKECRSLIIPYNQMTASSDPIQANSLSISYADLNGCQTDIFTIPAEYLTASKMAIRKAKAAKKYLIKLKTKCIGCGYISEDYADSAPPDERCHCGQLYERTIIR